MWSLYLVALKQCFKSNASKAMLQKQWKCRKTTLQNTKFIRIYSQIFLRVEKFF